jgi:hypothetical protein
MNEQDDKMTMAASQLATEIAPSRDLWPGIEEAIKAPQQPRQTPWFAQAAAVFLLVGASSMVTYSVLKYDEANTPQLVVQVIPTNLTFERAAFGALQLLRGVADCLNHLSGEFFHQPLLEICCETDQESGWGR